MNKTGVPKEAQDDALSNGTTGGRQTPTVRPTRGDVVRMTVFFVLFGCGRRSEALNFPFWRQLIFWRENIVGDGPLSPETTDRRQIWRALNSRNFYSRHVEFLRAPQMNRNKNSGPKGLLRSLSLPTLRSFSPSLHTSTLKQFPKFIFGDRDVFRSYVGFIQTSWEFCDDRSNKGCRALGVTSKRISTV